MPQMPHESDKLSSLDLQDLETGDFRQIETLVVNDPEAFMVLLHEQRWQVMEVLIKTAKTIRQLSDELKINPGTIKRHIDDLLAYNLIRPSKQFTNEHGITLKYYQAVAKKYILHLELSKDSPPKSQKKV